MTDNRQEGSLHDWLHLGEVELALSPEAQKGKDDTCRRRDQIHRLPILLRLLGGSQALSSIPSILGKEESTPSEETSKDSHIDGVVSRLEDVAATYSAAEGVDSLVSYLVPSVSRKIGKLPPLTRVYSTNPETRQKRKWEGSWETRELAMVASSPVGGNRKRRRTSEHIASVSSTDEIVAEEDEGDYEMMSQDDHAPSDKAKISATSSKEDDSPKTSQSFLVGASVAIEDSQESMVVKTLSEVASLVVSSLKPIGSTKDDSEDNQRHGSVTLSVASDSLLSEPGTAPDAVDGVGAIGGSDLGATVAALMHHAPVLRHRHVANALCRVASPQAPDIIARMAANCPSASSCLVHGCIDAYQTASVTLGPSPEASHEVILSTATSAVRAIAKLSPVESGRVAALLQRSNGVMMDLLLEIYIDDPLAVASLLIQHLSVAPGGGRPLWSTARHVRNKSSRRRIRPSHPVNGVYRIPSLCQCLHDSPSLTYRLCQSLIGDLGALRKSNEQPSWGRATVILRAYSLLLLRVKLEPADIPKGGPSGAELLGDTTHELQSLADKMSPVDNRRETPKRNKTMDRYYELLLCCCLVTCARSFQMEAAIDTDGSSSTVKALLQSLLSMSASVNSNVLTARVAGFLVRRKSTELAHLISAALQTASNVPSRGKLPVDGTLITGIDKTCLYAIENLELETASRLGLLESAVLEDVTATIESIHDGDMQASELRRLLSNLFQDPEKCRMLVHRQGVPQLIEESVCLLSSQEGPKIPLVLPMDLDTLAHRVKWPKSSRWSSLDILIYQYLLHVMYFLYFLGQEPESPFSIDLRNLPLQETTLACDIISKSEMKSAERSFGALLMDLLRKRCPEVASFSRVLLETSYCTPSNLDCDDESFHKEVKKMVIAAVRACLEDGGSDSSGDAAERAFVVAQTHLISSDIDSMVAGALLASRNSPLPYFSYGMLCRDPLVLLKCQLSVWRCQGLRRVTLSILGRLLEANDQIIRQASTTEEAASELIVARNTVVVRCLAIAASGGSPESTTVWLQPFYCSATLHMVRTLVARQRGIVAMLVKQGVPDITLDWLVEFVPESINDAEALKLLLSERSSLTAAERLKTADAALRVAIAHGSRDNVNVETLVYASLSVMVSSFFLVIGPVGVPVNVLCQEGELDVTQICRNSMLRMLRALRNVNGRKPAILNECAMALQKIAGLCKGESIMSGVPGVVATRRKNLLKEIWDAVVKAINTMGGGTQI